MEAELSKADKLKRRQEQLAKWKLKQSDATPEPETKINDAPKVSEDEKRKIERQRKLEEWKRKKQNGQLQKEESHELDERQKKLQAWKQKRQSTSAALKPVVKNLFASLPKVSKKVVAPTKRVLFEEEDETVASERVFKKPVVAKAHTDSNEDDVDALDAFLENLGEEKPDYTDLSGNKVPKTLDLEDEEENYESGDDELNRKIKSLQQGKDLKEIDHDQMDYLPFRKDFYTEPQSLQSLTEEDVSAMRLELDGIKVTGRRCPKPVWSFTQLGLSAFVMSIMEEKLNYRKPTPIQCQALPAIMSGRDVLGIGRTGSGKTLAYVLPLLKHIQDQPPLAPGDGPIAVLLSPTRELALQIYKQVTNFTKRLNISACCCYGGSSIEPQIAELKKGSQIVVSTPGRLIDLLAANNGRICNLKRVTYVVLDEADRMFDFGFGPQVTKIFSQIRPDKQSILFSATFARKLESLAKLTLKDPVEIVVGGISVVPPEITQVVEYFERSGSVEAEKLESEKFDKLVEVLAAFPDVKKLVFVEKQDSADKMLVKLLRENISSLTIHGGKDQIDRKHAIKEFSAEGSGIDVLIATSIAARGLDVKGLGLVVNYDPPNHMEDYVHRVGRTGRAGNTGTAITFVSSEQERSITDLVKALRLSKMAEGEIDPRLVKISEKFLGKVKDGKEKFRFGFGGNGLSKLDELRNSHQLVDRKVHGVEAKEVKSSTPKTESREASQVPSIDLPEFKVIDGRAEETAGPDKCKFHSRVTINDLPQKARWTVVNRESLSEIIEATSTSITNKGQFYPPNTKVPTTVKVGGKEVPAPPRLYLLIEGLTENAVQEANRMIRQKMLEGLELADKDDSLAPTGKYTV